VREALRDLRDDPPGLMRYWRELDDRDRAEATLALETARALMAAGDCREAQRVIEDALDERWDASLVLAYGECGGNGDILGRIAQAEKWLARQPRDGGAAADPGAPLPRAAALGQGPQLPGSGARDRALADRPRRTGPASGPA
jgi:hypothetical protein